MIVVKEWFSKGNVCSCSVDNSKGHFRIIESIWSFYSNLFFRSKLTICKRKYQIPQMELVSPVENQRAMLQAMRIPSYPFPSFRLAITKFKGMNKQVESILYVNHFVSKGLCRYLFKNSRDPMLQTEFEPYV